MSKPLIGLTPSHDTDNDDIKMRPTYLRALKAAGAIPVVMPLDVSEEDLVQLTMDLDGFLFTGGPDVHPFLFGEETHKNCGNVSEPRDQMELKLLPHVMKQNKPILGICRGIQILNIALGGSIWQDIPSMTDQIVPIAHAQPFSYHLPCHSVFLEEDSQLKEIVKKSTLKVNSMHHQAVRNLAPGLTASAYSADHLIEALEMPSYSFFIGVQWHPEYLWEKNEEAFRLFQTFVKSC